ncbi:MAG: asparagine synthase (glutamine-hydrolyzing) [Candidatus Krumholzibacteriota bacterium]|nr:asparagine synthase (glutamine-hydrolyzing) [Candidatus Krumholzibacteriota bacterium]
MCGVAGIFYLDPRREVDPALLRDMTAVLAHRGPDDHGFYLEGRIGLGHRRLAIIDLKSGHQPMASNDKTIWLSFNGEIYNFKELRRKLKSFGHSFRTKSDTEVIIQAYRQWGNDFLQYFNGMFAFALWDKSRNRLILARDRLGIKPLYTTVVDGALLFASEIKSLLRHPQLRREFDPESISSYLGYRCVLGDKTLFRGIEKLSPGHMLVAENGYLTNVNYWELPLLEKRKDRGEEYYQKKIRSLMRRSVKRRMISDVPLGAYLSGGLDSSIVVALMAQQSDRPVKTYTIGFPDDEFNESRFARAVADRYRTDHTEIVIDDREYLDILPELIRYKDAPLAVANEVPLHIMSRELKKDITVVLSGEGADELFAGYGRIFRSPFDYSRARFLERDSSIQPEFRDTLLSQFRLIYGTAHFLDELDHFIKKYHWMSPVDKETLLASKMIESINGDERIRKYFAEQFKRAGNLSHQDKLLYIFQKIHLENLLMRVDMTTMATAVEARVPFVDHQLVEFVFSMPFHYKLRWKSELHKIMASFLSSDKISENHDIPKYILKETFRSDLPEEIINRKKMGFPVPLDKWMGGRYRDFMKEILLDRRTARRGIINVPAIEKQLNRQPVPEHSTALKYWMLMNLELWFREYFDKREGGRISAIEESPAASRVS